MGLTRDDLIHHFCLVNDCEKSDFLNHEKDAFKKWRDRSKVDWNQDLSNYFVDYESIEDLK